MPRPRTATWFWWTLSDPKAIIAGLRAVTAAHAETPSSISIHTNVMLCSPRTALVGLELSIWAGFDRVPI